MKLTLTIEKSETFKGKIPFSLIWRFEGKQAYGKLPKRLRIVKGLYSINKQNRKRKKFRKFVNKFSAIP